MKSKLESKLLGGLYGLLIGDAVGTPYEFKSSSSIPPMDQIDMIPPAGFKKSWSAHPCGIWSDDGSQALNLLEYYTEVKPGDKWYETFAAKLVKWYDGHLWYNNNSFDSGIQTREAIENLRNGMHPAYAATHDVSRNGNGSLMRALPVALWNLNMDEVAFYQEVENISKITHPHARSRLCCVFYCDVARCLLNGASLKEAIYTTKRHIEERYSGELLEVWDLIWESRWLEPTGTGYVIDALWSAIWAVDKASSYEECIKLCISLGNDTDTTACIAGGLAGIIYGYEGIPSRWIAQLKGKELVHPLSSKLLARHGIV